MVKKNFFLLFTLFLFTVSPILKTKATEDNFSFLNDKSITKEEKKEKLLKIINKLQIRINILIEKRAAEIMESNKAFNSALISKINNDLNLQAKSYSVHLFNPKNDFLNNSQKIFYKNENDPYSLASVTKLLTAITAWENFNHNKKIKITKNALGQYGDFGLVLNERFSLYDSIVAMLTHSSNDMAYAISTSGYTGKRSKFFVLMNIKAKKIGMKKAYFESESGLDFPAGKSTASASSEDVIVLLKYFYKNYPNLSARTVKNNIISSNLKKHYLYNTNILLSEYNNFRLSKTGFEDSSGGNLATVYKIDNENYLAISVLNSTKKGRFYDTEKIIRSARKYIKEKK